MDERCDASLKVGNCALAPPKYFFDKAHNKCVEQSLGDCSGDEVKFDTENECHRACVRHYCGGG